ncbi:DUF2927 domain-containing protein [Pedobacter polaris]|uniref:DUF2927 domain-containing protein n=1 Tax=Pedobacter polaris TaxID=2571273 RepID=UPI00145ED1BB|nr:DUF2927 domain-containing protein [Pedobacter polaris]
MFVAISIDAYAQKLTENEKTVFDEIVYKRKKVGEYETLSKWAIPIRYKIYGDTSSYLVKEVDSFFNLIKKITSYDIKKTDNADEENFTIVFGTKPGDFKEYTLSKAPLEAAASYRKRVTSNSEIKRAHSLINTKKFRDRINIKNAVKKNIIKGLGFENDSKLAPNSIFNTKSDNYKIEDFDIHIISALYLQAIKPGMTRDEVDKILNP